MKRMLIVKEEVSLSQLKMATVPPEEEDVPVPQGPPVAVPQRKRRSQAPYHGPTRRKGMPCLSR
jgi:hypothetical protein